jgi:hypothetical protein
MPERLAPRARATGLPWSFALAYLVGIGLIVLLVHYAGVWNILANTRVLDLLARGGIVAVTDMDQGLVYGIPDTDYYVASQDPVDWDLVLVAALLFLAMWGVRAVQFHALARFAGIDGSIGQHARAYVYGKGINRLLPFGVGNVAAASALEAQGAERGRVSSILFLAAVFGVFELVVFGLYGLLSVGLMGWAGEIFWPLVILLAAYLMTRPERGAARASRRATALAARQALGVLIREPRALVAFTVLALLAFLLLDVGAYLITQSFTSPNVILNVTFAQITMGIVGGYAARLISLTPGGIGQWEWGCAAALYTSGLGFPEAATIAILVSAVRYVTGGVLFATITLGPGVETSLRESLGRFRGDSPEAEAARP